ncbi:39S ribosomal protein L24, mitochondrial [Gonapodya sp. JEL0774]|nr:39S ribosomal protein L24, mitochondrial [Gonapodya sp. JEL0774]
MSSKLYHKMKGGNLLKPKRVNVPPEQRLKNPKILVGDLVQVLKGSAAGQQGKIVRMDRDRGLVFVEGVAKFPEGTTVTLEGALRYSNIALVDPVHKIPTKITYAAAQHPGTGLTRKYRVSKLSGEVIPFPEKEDPTKDAVEGPRDTTSRLVDQITFTATYDKPPLPVPLLNEIFRWERHGKGGRGF